jgi:hypothetical protein
MNELNPSNVSENDIEMLLSKDKNKRTTATRQINENKIHENKMKLAAMLSGEVSPVLKDTIKNINLINQISENKIVTEGNQIIDKQPGYKAPNNLIEHEERIPDDIQSLIKQKYQQERNNGQQGMVNEQQIMGLLNKQKQVLNEETIPMDIDSKIKDAIIKVMAEMLTEEKIKKVLMDVLKKMKK